jgi:hypothetical protein
MLLTEGVISSFISPSGWGVLLTSMTLQTLHVLDAKLLLLPLLLQHLFFNHPGCEFHCC